MTLSHILNLPIRGHQDIDFIDIDETIDTLLFLDPSVIQFSPDEFCLNAQPVISSFFREIFSACAANDTTRLQELCAHASEPNETNLGMKKSTVFGKGTTASELAQSFMAFYKDIVANGYPAVDPVIACFYMPNFDKDKMSDLLTNILRQQLYQFTCKQANKWNIALSQNTEELGHYWSADTLQWEPLHGHSLNIRGNNFLLVPKHIVRKHYLANVETYIRQYILANEQDVHLKNNSDLCTRKEYANGRTVLQPPTRKELYAHDVHGRKHKEFALKSTISKPSLESTYFRDLTTRIKNGESSLSNTQLDDIAYSGSHSDAS